MREFTIYAELDERGKISPQSMQRLVKYCECLRDVSLQFTWINTFRKIKAQTVHSIIHFERTHCTFKRNIVRNCIISETEKVSPLAKYLMFKYKFSLKKQNNTEVEKDYVSMCFGNKPGSCAFSSCLGNCIFINAVGTPGICPFIENDVKLNNTLNIQSLYDVFNSQSFADILKKSIEHRNNCKNNCEYFALCKGGCPLTSDKQQPDSCKIKTSIGCAGEKLAGSTMLDPMLREQTIEKVSNMYQI